MWNWSNLGCPLPHKFAFRARWKALILDHAHTITYKINEISIITSITLITNIEYSFHTSFLSGKMKAWILWSKEHQVTLEIFIKKMQKYDCLCYSQLISLMNKWGKWRSCEKLKNIYTLLMKIKSLAHAPYTCIIPIYLVKNLLKAFS